jgi:beta-phosphoglucomutase-like phosphatase (HAD superfamily)
VYQAYVAGKPREAGARAALEYFGIPDPDGTRLREYMEVKQADLVALIERGEFVAFDDALRFLLDLKAAGVKIGAASSSKNANVFLRKVALAKYAGLTPHPPSPIPASDQGPSPEPDRADPARQPQPASELADPDTPPATSARYPFLTPESTLLDMFDANVCGRDFAHGKPDPEIFVTAAAELGLAPAMCFVVEDAQSGVQAAKAGGMAAVGVARLGDEALLRAAGADWVVTSLDDLPAQAVL